MRKNVTAAPSKDGLTMMRVTRVFADGVRRAAQVKDVSQSDLTEKYLLPVVDQLYREAVLAEAERLAGPTNS